MSQGKTTIDNETIRNRVERHGGRRACVIATGDDEDLLRFAGSPRRSAASTDADIVVKASGVGPFDDATLAGGMRTARAESAA